MAEDMTSCSIGTMCQNKEDSAINDRGVCLLHRWQSFCKCNSSQATETGPHRLPGSEFGLGCSTADVAFSLRQLNEKRGEETQLEYEVYSSFSQRLRRWIGHAHRMSYGRNTNDLLYGELDTGKIEHGRRCLR